MSAKINWKMSWKAWVWQAAIFISILISGLINEILFVTAVTLWAGWTIKIARRKSILLPIQIFVIIFSILITLWIIGKF